jgi:hypothetical protein
MIPITTRLEKMINENIDKDVVVLLFNRKSWVV